MSTRREEKGGLFFFLVVREWDKERFTWTRSALLEESWRFFSFLSRSLPPPLQFPESEEGFSVVVA
jgi:hypothetical protein